MAVNPTNFFADQRQFLVSIASCSAGGVSLTFPGYWGQTSGGGWSVPVVKAYDGGNPQAEVVTGNPLVADLTVTRNFSSGAHRPFIAKLKLAMNSGAAIRTTIKQVDTDANYSPTGQSGDIWTGQLTGFTPPALDAIKSGASTATIALVWSVVKLS